jgi:hypothetical protein
MRYEQPQLHKRQVTPIPTCTLLLKPSEDLWAMATCLANIAASQDMFPASPTVSTSTPSTPSEPSAPTRKVDGCLAPLAPVVIPECLRCMSPFVLSLLPHELPIRLRPHPRYQILIQVPSAGEVVKGRVTVHICKTDLLSTKFRDDELADFFLPMELIRNVSVCRCENRTPRLIILGFWPYLISFRVVLDVLVTSQDTRGLTQTPNVVYRLLNLF